MPFPQAWRLLANNSPALLDMDHSPTMSQPVWPDPNAMHQERPHETMAGPASRLSVVMNWKLVFGSLPLMTATMLVQFDGGQATINSGAFWCSGKLMNVMRRCW